MDTNSIFVLCATDSDIHRIERLMQDPSWRCINPAIATFRGPRDPEPVCLPRFAADHGMEYYLAPQQTWAPLGREFHACEIIGALSISRHFYKTYDRVFLAHCDIAFTGNPTSAYVGCGNWSLIAPRIESGDGTDRLSQELFTLSGEFVAYMYAKFGDEQNMWHRLFCGLNMHGDLALFVFMDYNGFTGIDIQSPVRHGGALS